jgi:uncharacterized protein
MSFNPRIFIKELKPINVEGGYLIDGFPSIGVTAAIATESMIHTSQFEMAGIIDSSGFPPVTIIKNGIPNYPTRIFVNNDLKTAIFSSYLTLHYSLHKIIARIMLGWAKRHKCSLVLSSAPVNTPTVDNQVIAAVSNNGARQIVEKAKITILQHGTIPGIPGALLNQGMINDQNVVVLLYNSDETKPDFKASTQLCLTMSKLVPGVSCDIPMLQKEADLAEEYIRQAEKDTKGMVDTMYG